MFKKPNAKHDWRKLSTKYNSELKNKRGSKKKKS